MSRCFPFPPPRYEKTVRPDAQLASQQQQLDKVEQHPHPTPHPALLIDRLVVHSC